MKGLLAPSLKVVIGHASVLYLRFPESVPLQVRMSMGKLPECKCEDARDGIVVYEGKIH